MLGDNDLEIKATNLGFVVLCSQNWLIGLELLRVFYNYLV